MTWTPSPRFVAAAVQSRAHRLRGLGMAAAEVDGRPPLLLTPAAVSKSHDVVTVQAAPVAADWDTRRVQVADADVPPLSHLQGWPKTSGILPLWPLPSSFTVISPYRHALPAASAVVG